MRRSGRHIALVVSMLVIVIPLMFLINASASYDEWIKRLASFVLGCAFTGFIWDIREELS